MRLPFFGRQRPVSLRTASTPDAADLSAIHARSFAHPWPTLTVEHMLTEKNIIGHVAEDREVVGFILSRLAADEAEILTIAVTSAARGTGIGRRLLDENIASLVRQNIKQLFLEVEEGNSAAIALYQSAGFARIGTRKGYYRTADGQSRDAVTMRKDLSREAVGPPSRLR